MRAVCCAAAAGECGPCLCAPGDLACPSRKWGSWGAQQLQAKGCRGVTYHCRPAQCRPDPREQRPHAESSARTAAPRAWCEPRAGRRSRTT